MKGALSNKVLVLRVHPGFAYQMKVKEGLVWKLKSTSTSHNYPVLRILYGSYLFQQKFCHAWQPRESVKTTSFLKSCSFFLMHMHEVIM